MGFFVKVAGFDSPYENEETTFGVDWGTNLYAIGSSGRLWEWDGISSTQTLIADAPASFITDIAIFGSELYGAGNNGTLYKWNGATPAVSKGGTGAWTAVASVGGTRLFAVGVHNSNLYVGGGDNGSLYELQGSSLVLKAPQLGSEVVIHFLLSVNSKLYSPTAYTTRLYEWNGVDAWVNKVNTSALLNQIEGITLTKDDTDRIYTATKPDGYLFRWNGSNDWVKIADRPSSLTGWGHTLLFLDGKIYVLYSDGGVGVYNIALDTMSVLIEPPTYGSYSSMAALSGELYIWGRDGLYRVYDYVTPEEALVEGGDVKLFYGTEYFDTAVSGGDFVRDPGLETAIIISLFTNARAQDTDLPLPDNSDSREGWWGDDHIGSKLWLLGRSKTQLDIAEQARQYAEESLLWMVQDGVAASIMVTPEIIAHDTIQLTIEVQRPDADPVFYKYYYNWQNQIFGRA